MVKTFGIGGDVYHKPKGLGIEPMRGAGRRGSANF
jgi:hypothetical protein